jgi:hypothetical protein
MVVHALYVRGPALLSLFLLLQIRTQPHLGCAMAIYESCAKLVSEYQALNFVVMAVPGKFQSCSGVLLVLRDGY